MINKMVMMGFVGTTSPAHFIDFGTSVGTWMCARPFPCHRWENVGLIELEFSMSSFIIFYGRAWWLCVADDAILF